MTMKHWELYNQHLVERIKRLWDFSYLETWQKDLEKMNAGKVGRPFKYPTSFILSLVLLKVTYGMSYRDQQGMLAALQEVIPLIKVPDYTTICRRLEDLVFQIQDKVPKEVLEAIKNDKAKVAIDSSGLSITCRGEWLRYKHKDGRILTKKGFVKIHIGVDVSKGTILGVEVTNERIPDNAAMPSITYQVKDIADIEAMFGDGAYDAYRNYRELDSLSIKPVIKPRRTSIVLSDSFGYVAGRRSTYVYEIKKHGYDYWRKKHSYGLRWMAEVAFSSFKRRFGESLMSKKFENMQKEVQLKVLAYNMLTNWPRGW